MPTLDRTRYLDLSDGLFLLSQQLRKGEWQDHKLDIETKQNIFYKVYKDIEFELQRSSCKVKVKGQLFRIDCSKSWFCPSSFMIYHCTVIHLQILADLFPGGFWPPVLVSKNNTFWLILIKMKIEEPVFWPKFWHTIDLSDYQYPFSSHFVFRLLKL